LWLRRRRVANGSDINEVFRPLHILGGDVGEGGPARGGFERFLDRLLSKSTEHEEREKEREWVYNKYQRRCAEPVRANGATAKPTLVMATFIT
jgi:hypothetical protein